MKTAFICYSHKDGKFAENLAKRLSKSGIEVWLDKWKIKIGDRITQKINQALKKQDFVVVLLSKNSIRSRWVSEEIGAALHKGGEIILPLALPGLKDKDIPPLLKDRLYADFRKNPEEAFEQLLAVLNPSIEFLQNVLDPFKRGRIVVLTGTSTRLYQKGPKWSVASAGSVGAQFAFQETFKHLFKEDREILWNYADSMPLNRLCKGDNVFTVGSPKVNKFSNGFLSQCNRKGIGSIWFVGRKEWINCGTFYALKGKNEVYRPTINRIAGQGTGKDYGLIVWAPILNPHLGMTLITGGCHTGATHAAAEYAVVPKFYEELFKNEPIRRKFENKKTGFWAIIVVHCTDFSPDLDSISICEFGVLTKNKKMIETDFDTNVDVVWDTPATGTYIPPISINSPNKLGKKRKDISWTPSKEMLADAYPSMSYGDALRYWCWMVKGEGSCSV